MDQITKNVSLASAGVTADPFFLAAVTSNDTNQNLYGSSSSTKNPWHQVLSNGDIIVSATRDVAASTTNRNFPLFTRFDKRGNVIDSKSWYVVETVTVGDGGPQGAFYYDEATDDVFYLHGNNTTIYLVSQNWVTDTVNWAVNLVPGIQNSSYWANVEPCSNGTHILVTQASRYSTTSYPNSFQMQTFEMSTGSSTDSGSTHRITSGSATAKANAIMSDGRAWIQYSAASYNIDNQTHYFSTVDTSATSPNTSAAGVTPRFNLTQNAPNHYGSVSCALSPDENYLYNVGTAASFLQVTKVDISTNTESIVWDQSYTFPITSPETTNSPLVYGGSIVVDSEGYVYVAVDAARIHGQLTSEYCFVILKIDPTDGSIVYTKRLKTDTTIAGNTATWTLGRLSLTENNNFVISGVINSAIGPSANVRTSSVLFQLPNDTDTQTFDQFIFATMTNPIAANNNVGIGTGGQATNFSSTGNVLNASRTVVAEDFTADTTYESYKIEIQ